MDHTPYALRELVKAIYIEAQDKSSGKRHQGIRNSYPEKIRYYFLMTPDHCSRGAFY